ncbi:hypothetical protein [Alteraurantiacibacter palmitatis]|uniref:Uncharacterized protein n=1 Tax=Alteraurantiacibacter palmitatis TaxID=2054628 RepID=A0ABV7E2V9_9SPHN
MDVNRSRTPEQATRQELRLLLSSIEAATGADRELDKAICEGLGLKDADLTGDAVASHEAVGQLLPRSQLRVGYDVRGILPRATLEQEGARYDAVAPTVPLAIWRVAVAALIDPKS